MDSRWKRSDSNPVFKWKLGTKAEIWTSGERRTAGCRSQPKSSVFLSLLLFSPWKTWGEEKDTRQQPFCLLNLTFPFKVSEAALSFLKGGGVVTITSRVYTPPPISEQTRVLVPTTGLHADFRAIKTRGSRSKHDWRCSRQESGPTKTFSISGQLVGTRRSMFLRTGIRPASTCHNKLPRGKVLPFGGPAL